MGGSNPARTPLSLLSLRCNLSTATQRQALTLCLVLSRCCVGGGEGKEERKEGRKGDGRGRGWAGLRTRTASGLHVFAGGGGLYAIIVTPEILINVFSSLHQKQRFFFFLFFENFRHLAEYFLKNYLHSIVTSFTFIFFKSTQIALNFHKSILKKSLKFRHFAKYFFKKCLYFIEYSPTFFFLNLPKSP
jgi:hypothetical protein